MNTLRRIVTWVSGIGNHPLNRVVEESLHRWDQFGQGVAVVGIARQGRDVGDELAAL